MPYVAFWQVEGAGDGIGIDLFLSTPPIIKILVA